MHIYKFSFILLTKSQSVVTKLLNPLRPDEDDLLKFLEGKS